MQHGGGFLANVVFTFGEADKEGGNETLWTRFIFNVGSSITVFIYGGCKYLMWFLIWLQFLHGEFEYYHIDTFGSEENCKIQLEKSKVLITNSASSVACFEVDRNG